MDVYFEGGLVRKLRFDIFNFNFWGKFTRKLCNIIFNFLIFEGSLTRTLRFAILNFQSLREVSYAKRLWKIADAQDAMFCSTECFFGRYGEGLPRGGCEIIPGV